jgi:hypothetical protein
MEQSGGKKRSRSKSLARSLFTSPMGRSPKDFARTAKVNPNASGAVRKLSDVIPATPFNQVSPTMPSAATTYQETIREMLTVTPTFVSNISPLNSRKV